MISESASRATSVTVFNSPATCCEVASGKESALFKTSVMDALMVSRSFANSIFASSSCLTTCKTVSLSFPSASTASLSTDFRISPEKFCKVLTSSRVSCVKSVTFFRPAAIFCEVTSVSALSNTSPTVSLITSSSPANAVFAPSSAFIVCKIASLS